MEALPTPRRQRLIAALTALKRLQDSGRVAVRSRELTRADREALLVAGYLKRVVRDWYMPSRPGESDGDTTSWYSAAHDFIARYCESRFGDQWCVSAEYSILLHAGQTTLPRQVGIQAPAGQNGVLQLPAGHSLLEIRAKSFPSASWLTRVGSLRAMTLEHALTRVSEAFFRAFPRDAQIALGCLRDVDSLAVALVEGGHSVVAGRLAGALRAVGRAGLADEILATMRTLGYTVREVNPFEAPLPGLSPERAESPHVARIRLAWAAMRPVVIERFPPDPGLPGDIEAYLSDVDDRYATDAYHSLSIEGYRVTDELVARVARGDWRPDHDEADARDRNAMAAHGYWRAHRAVKESIRKILGGANPGTALREDHRTWFRQLFAPSVDAGILQAADLAGYRRHQVYIRNARHVPLPPEAVREAMPVLWDLLEAEQSAAARAVLGHFVFVYIHPYMDGNGRLARFLMNAMLASGGHRWTVLRLEHRDLYMNALDAASSDGNIAAFAEFVASSLAASSPSRPA
jgi:fido (protein-threonine AMPylation protein)